MIRIIMTFALLSALATPAHAALTNYCYVDTSTDMPWFTAGTAVPIWLNVSGSTSATTATQLSQWDVEASLQRALYIWNEQSGTRIKLKYMGITTSSGITGAVVVIGNSTSCGAGDVSADAEAKIFVRSTGFPYYRLKWSSAQVVLYKQAGSSCASRVWQTVPGGDLDLVEVLEHELGHAVYNFGHPDDPNYSTCTYGFPVDSLMGSSPTRDLTSWDKELAQRKYGIRSVQSSIWRTRMTSATTWQAAFMLQAADSVDATPLYRMSSMSTALGIRGFGWVDNGPGGGTLRDGGAGYQVSVSQYLGNALNNWYYEQASMGQPVAVASQPTTTLGLNPPVDMLLAYPKRDTSVDMYSDAGNVANVCWRVSPDGGFSWGAEQCLGKTKTYGLTAAYDPNSNAFLVAYTNAESTTLNEIYVDVIPASPNAFAPFARGFGISALHAPSIACTGVYPRCLAAYESVNSSGSLAGTFFGVTINPPLYRVILSNSYAWSIPLWDTPSIVYLPDDNAFHLAKTEGSNAIFSYALGNADPTLTWNGTGDIWNSPTSNVLTGVGAIRNWGASKRVEGWFVRIW